MNRRDFPIGLALLALVLGSGACSVVVGSRSDLTSKSYTTTGVLKPVVAVGERPGSVLTEMAVAAPVLRLDVKETAFRLVVPWFVEIEVSDLGTRVGIFK